LSKIPEYSTITEAPGLKATGEQLARIYQRYEFCRGFAFGADVFEAACGSGIGLGFLAQRARKVWGADIDPINIEAARSIPDEVPQTSGTTAAPVGLLRMNAQDIGFKDGRFDLVLLLEAVYYLPEPGRFFAEAYRVLRPGGRLIIGSVNRDWADFHPSPFAHGYFSVPEMAELLTREFPAVEVFGGFKVETGGLRNVVTSKIKHLALNFKLIPGSLKMRAYLKRIFIGKLIALPPVISEGAAAYEPPVALPVDAACRDRKILYFVARKPA